MFRRVSGRQSRPSSLRSEVGNTGGLRESGDPLFFMYHDYSVVVMVAFLILVFGVVIWANDTREP